jgi:hypoxanthine phosphoribosyltransferase
LSGETIAPPEAPGPSFAHASEAEMARILDFYEVRWDYEPHVYPLRWNLNGDVVESFAPDFFLPDLDLYVELTTLKQRLVRKKNRKLRRLRALYPDLRIKLFYARDFRALMLKYGRIALADELSGTTGHLVPDRDAEPADEGTEQAIVEPAAPVSTAAGRRCRRGGRATRPAPAKGAS